MEDKPPPSLKAVQPYVLVARQFVKRDPVVAYYVNMYAVQEGIKLGKKDSEAKAYLLNMMDKLQAEKAKLKDDEAINNDVVATAHIEEVAMRLFDFADGQDRNGQFGRDMIKAFFTSSHIFTTLRQFGEISEEVESKMKYAKWKAVEIDRCLKSGITPTPGPPGGEEGDEFGLFGGQEVVPPEPGFNVQPPGQEEVWVPPGAQQVLPPRPVPRPRQNVHQDPQPPPEGPMTTPPQSFTSFQPTPPVQDPVAAVQLGPTEIAQAQKLCKFATSALDYDDVQGAVEFLGKAMRLLTTGKEK